MTFKPDARQKGTEVTTQWPVVKEVLRNKRDEILRSIEARDIAIAQAQKQIDSSREELTKLLSAEIEISLWLKEHSDKQDI